MTQSEENPFEMQVDFALAEYMQKCDAGQVPERDEFLSRHPDLREQLSELLSAADWIEKLAGPKLSELNASGEAAGEFTDRVEETLPRELAFFGQSHALHSTLPLGAPTNPRKFALNRQVVAAEESQPMLPCRFGEYLLERVLGRGGMGVVYFGRQVQLDRPVAIKMIRSGALASQEEVVRFYAEARSAAKLDHPNIVTVYQCGEINGHHFFSMDYVPGTDLSKMIKDGPIDCKRGARYVRDVARAIQFAHDRGILHRDLKPANVLVDEHDNVRITDFGLAKSIGTDTGLTATGVALGTPSFMSPEQAAGKVEEQHHATDVYSLGAILFTVVTGQPPFKAEGVVQTILQVIHRPAPLARSFRPNVDADIETIIDVCLQKSPERRYASAAALADDLHRYLQGTPIQARPASALRRAWYWVLGIPIMGAILDNRVVEPTDAHRWVQRGMISVGLMFLLSWFAVLVPSNVWTHNRMPKQVRVAAGIAGSDYDKLARAICDMLTQNAQCKAEPIPSSGSSDNYEKLERGEVDLALLQADAVDSSNVAVVAPLYYEAVHILVTPKLGISAIGHLKNRRVIVGPEKSGARNVAQLLLGRDGLTLEDIEIDLTDWRSLETLPVADAAIVVARPGAKLLVDLLCAGDYRLLPIADSLQFAMDEPVFHALLLEPDRYPNCGLPESGVATVATTAYLAAKLETPAVLIQAVLRELFDPVLFRELGTFSAERAAHWPDHGWHPAAREFFHAYQGTSSTARSSTY